MDPSGIKVKKGVLMVKFKDDWIALDPKYTVNSKYIFISHAHSDHVPPYIGDSKVIASRETVEILKAKGYRVREYTEDLRGVELVDTGHILGSRGILIEGRVFYTGDIAGRPRGFLDKARSRSCETLIVDSTYGRSEYKFPHLAWILRNTMNAIASEFEKGKGIALLGYSLGKAQLLTYLFQSWKPLYVYKTIEMFNSVYRKMGIDIPYPDSVTSNIKELPKNRPFLLIAPNNPTIVRMLKNLGIRYIAFTGWAINKIRNGLPLSDHADYDELISFVKRSNPDRIYTVFGHSRDFAYSLRRLGFLANPISSLHTYITDYFE